MAAYMTDYDTDIYVSISDENAFISIYVTITFLSVIFIVARILAEQA